MNTFRSVPFLRILMPFVAGILAAYYYRLYITYWVLPALLLGYFLFRNVFSTPKAQKRFLHVICDVFLFCAAIFLVLHCDLRNRGDYFTREPLGNRRAELIAYVADLPEERGRWFRCAMQVVYAKSGNRLVPASGKLLAYFRKEAFPAKPEPGQSMFINTRLVPAPAPLNPHEFDYRNWLANKQVFHTCFLDKGDVVSLKIPSAINPVWKFGLYCRKFLLNSLLTSGIDGQTYAICAALLTGQDNDVDKDTIAAFAHSGTLHVLSVSGLHTGMVYLALNFLFGLFVRTKESKPGRFLFITAGLWLFGLMTGFAAPVLRAVIMFNLIGYGRIFFRNDSRNQLNILFVSAFILLFYNPYFLFEVGFLLSYFALFGLICITPLISSAWTPSGYLGNFVWKSFCASVAATASTLPVTLFFFKQFPIWFFLCNLVVVPVSSLILLLSVLLVLRLKFLAGITSWLVKGLVTFLGWFNAPGIAYVDYLDFDLGDVLFSSLFILLLSMALYQRSFQMVAATMLTVISWQVYSLISSYQAKSNSFLTIYHLRKHSAASVKNRRHLNYFISDSAAFNYHLKPHFISFNRPAVQCRQFNFVGSGHNSVVFQGGKQALPFIYRHAASTLVLSNDAPLPGDLSEEYPRLQVVICDGSNSGAYVEATQELCRKFDLRFHNTAESGAIELALK